MDPAAAVTAGYKGTYGPAPTSGPTAVTGKTVWVISCGQAAYSCSIPAGHAMEAVQAIGWKGNLCDGKLDPSVEGACVQQAVAAGANAVLLAGIDCSGLSAPLKAAKAAGLKIVDPLGFDCDDPSVGGTPVFDAPMELNGYANLKDYITDWGASKAAWIIGNNPNAKVIDVTLGGVLVPTYADQGFVAMMKKCAGCSIVDTVQLSLQDVGGGTVQQKIETALQQHPEATVIHPPFDSAIPAWVVGALKDTGRTNMTVMGSECFETNLDLIRTGGGESACSAIPDEWLEWAAVDSLNRLWSGETVSQLPDSGAGFQLVDKTHNLPASGAYVTPVDFKSAYLKVWGK
jgi:ribose transport system substrate-binding protein